MLHAHSITTYSSLEVTLNNDLSYKQIIKPGPNFLKGPKNSFRIPASTDDSTVVAQLFRQTIRGEMPVKNLNFGQLRSMMLQNNHELFSTAKSCASLSLHYGARGFALTLDCNKSSEATAARRLQPSLESLSSSWVCVDSRDFAADNSEPPKDNRWLIVERAGVASSQENYEN